MSHDFLFFLACMILLKPVGLDLQLIIMAPITVLGHSWRYTRAVLSLEQDLTILFNIIFHKVV